MKAFTERFLAAGIFGTVSGIAAGALTTYLTANPYAGWLIGVPTFIGVTYKTRK